ncbi:MAG: hypothetical protein ACREMW_10655 [Gemmatimonadales bacterium]
MNARSLGAVASVALLSACQPQARRLLLLDEALTQGAELEATARPWQRAGYSVEYRRYYPHLTRDDLHRYRVVMILGGHRPSAATDALDVGDLAILTEWTQGGGVVVLGYPPGGSGTFDRWLMNRWLDWSGAGISIGDVTLADGAGAAASPSARPVLTSGLRGTGFDAFPAGASDALLVTDDARVIARSGEGARVRSPGPEHAARPDAAIVAASRVGDGLVVVVSRPVLGALGQRATPDQSVIAPAARAGTQAFLVALARWTRRPAEWARIPTAGPRVPLRLAGGPLPVTLRSPRERPPDGVTVERLARRHLPVPPLPARSVPAWITRQGVRGLQAAFPALSPTTRGAARHAALDSLATLLDIGAFNALITNAYVAPLADSTGTQRWERDALRDAWRVVTERLQSTSVRWIPLVLPLGLRTSDSATAEDCALDPALWSRLASGARVLARLAARHPDLIPAVGFGLDETTRSWSGPAFCDATWQAGLGALSRNATLTRQRLARLSAVPVAARYDSLLEGGLLAAYDSGVTRVVVQRAATLRADLSRIRRTLLFAIVVDRSPTDWFTRSLVRGLSTPGTPVLLFSPDRRARETLEAMGDVNLLHAVRLDPDEILSGGVARLGHALFNDQVGFWLGPAESILAGPSDSLARQVRRLTKER